MKVLEPFLVAVVFAPMMVAVAQEPDTLPRVGLHNVFAGEPEDVLLPVEGKAGLLFPISVDTGLNRIDLIRALRMVRSRFGDRLTITTVLVDIGQVDAKTIRYITNEARTLRSMGLHGGILFSELKDDSGEWYEQLGRPELPDGLLVDGEGKILARHVFMGPPKWETERIEALLAGRPAPPSLIIAREQQRRALRDHPFYQAIDAFEFIDAVFDWAAAVKALSLIDAGRAEAALRAFAQRTGDLTTGREVALACLAHYGASRCLWAREFIDTEAVGRVSSSLRGLRASTRIENPGGRMWVKVDTKLYSLWNDSLVGRFQHNAFVDPGSKVSFSHDHFLRHNAGWGDYCAVHEVEVIMHTGSWKEKNMEALPPIYRIFREGIAFTPRIEFGYEPPIVEPDPSLTEDERAITQAVRVVKRRLKYSAAKPDPEHTPTIEADKAHFIGKAFPPFKLQRWIQGKEHFAGGTGFEVDSLGGKVVLLDFLYTGCLPCRKSLPGLTALHERYQGRGFVVLSLCTAWGDKGLDDLVDELKVQHPVAVLDDGVEETYEVKLHPTYVLIDKTGVVRWVGVGLWNEPPASEIEKLLAAGIAKGE